MRSAERLGAASHVAIVLVGAGMGAGCCRPEKALAVADELALKLSRDQALVLFDWLARTSNAGEPGRFDDQAEQRGLSDLERLHRFQEPLS